MYAIQFTDGTVVGGYRSEAGAVRAAIEVYNDPKAVIEWMPERQDLGTAEKLAEELDLDL